MPTELEELVEFLHHGNTQIRQIAAENLVGYSTQQPALFKRNQLEPVKDLKLLVKDYAPIAKNAITILINTSEDGEVLENLATDDAFLESILRRVVDAKEPNADDICMLLANLSKSEAMIKLLSLKREVPKSLSSSPLAIDQLLDCFVKGADGKYNKNAGYNYLSYLFADLAKHDEGQKHFLKSGDDDVVPLTKLIVFTEHKSTIRRRGVANTIKNVSFNISSHAEFLSPRGVNLLPYILLPLMGNEDYSEEDTEGMLDEVQLLDPDKQRESEPDIICTHLETLLILCTTREGRDKLRNVKVYPILRELHLQVKDDDVRDLCDRLVQMLMRGEMSSSNNQAQVKPQVQEVEEDEDDQIVEIV
ncbi:DUF383-domain-containing protein [Piedraia hortae CBS 480.64]|uniref:Protein HGH1 homolog n=1 Tax=Piedraia hortae CBS 480.64 TaxID=1314780 RepID=A0A6A7BXV7_9PEZI|nr:DUF383-domain-containing protein [Piedraia hortae CBS 480.64]